MTIQELFDEMRAEADWSKEVVLLTSDGETVSLKWIPNIMNDSQMLLAEEN